MRGPVITQTKREQDLCASFHTRSEIDGITLINATIRRLDDWNGVQMPLKIDYTYSPGSVISTGSNVGIRTEFAFRAMDSSDPAQPAIVIECTFEAAYSLDPEYTPAEDHVEAFRTSNAIFNVWPFFRELVINSIGRMQMPPPPVPFLRLRGRPESDVQGAAPAESGQRAPTRKRGKRAVSPSKGK
jgi:hypothetical protein